MICFQHKKNKIMIVKGYKLKHEFPNESYIQESLESHFTILGFRLIKEKTIDLKCIHPDSNETWIIEIKGKTSQIGLDFRTCLGQIILQMNNDNYTYAIAMPDIEQYRKQILNVPIMITNKLNLNWILVQENGFVNIMRNKK